MLKMKKKVFQTEPVNVDGLVLHQVIGTDRDDLVAQLGEITGVRRDFPGPLPVSIERADFHKLGRAEYFACEKTDGWRALMLVTHFRGEQMVVLFDRTLTPYIPLRLAKIPTVLFQTSVFDGEVARTIDHERRWNFLVFDALMVSGINITRRNFQYRICVTNEAWAQYTPCGTDSLHIRIKKFIPASDIEALPGYLIGVAEVFKTDGVILTPNIPGFVVGKHSTLFKLKTSVHSVDFLIGPEDGGRALHVYDSKHNTHKRVATLSRESPQVPSGAIVECVPTGDSSTWTLLIMRTDKSKANSMFTFAKTMLNARENIQIDEIVKVIKSKKNGHSM